MGRGIVSGRVALLPRSTEIRPHRPNDLLPPSTRQVQGEPVDRRQTLGKNRGPKPPRAVTHLEWARVGAEPRTWSGARRDATRREAQLPGGLNTAKGVNPTLRKKIPCAARLRHAPGGPTAGWSRRCLGAKRDTWGNKIPRYRVNWATSKDCRDAVIPRLLHQIPSEL